MNDSLPFGARIGCPLAQAAGTHGYVSSNQPITRTYDGGTAVNRIAKAIIAGATALAGGVGTAAADGSITATEWAVTVCAVVIAAVAVWATPNAPADPKP